MFFIRYILSHIKTFSVIERCDAVLLAVFSRVIFCSKSRTALFMYARGKSYLTWSRQGVKIKHNVK